MLFAWDEWNIDHIDRHAIRPREAEYVIRHARNPWPEQKGHHKLVVWGPTAGGRLIQVIFALKHPDEVEFDALTIDEWAELGEDDRLIYVVHAMDLTPAMKRIYRRRLES